MSPWINSGNYVGVDLNPGGLSVILENYTDAINERFDLLAPGEVKPQYHTNAGDKTVPVAADFIGLEFTAPRTDLVQVLDDIEEGISRLLALVAFFDPDDLTVRYDSFTDVALDITGSIARPRVDVTDKALWNFYKDIISALYISRKTILAGEPTEDSKKGKVYFGDDASQDGEGAWDEMLASDPIVADPSSNPTGLFASTSDPIVFNWVVIDDRTYSYDFAWAAGGTIVKDRVVFRTRTGEPVGGLDFGTLTHAFTLTFDDPTGPVEVLALSPPPFGAVSEVFVGEAPTLFGLKRSGEINISIDFDGLPADQAWALKNNPPESAFLSVDAGSFDVTPPLLEMWIDYASEFDFT